MNTYPIYKIGCSNFDIEGQHPFGYIDLPTNFKVVSYYNDGSKAIVDENGKVWQLRMKTRFKTNSKYDKFQKREFYIMRMNDTIDVNWHWN